MSRHLHHFTKCPFEVKKRAERTVPSLGGHCKQANSATFCSPLWRNIRFSKSWSSYLLIFLVFCRKKGCFLAGKGLCYVVVTRFCRDMSFVAFTCFFGLVLMQTFMQTLRILCRSCADFCTKKCSLEALFWSLGSKAEAPACGCFEGTSTSLRVPGDAKMVLERAIKIKNRVINQERMFSTDIQPCGSS